MDTHCSFLVWLLNLKSISCFVQSIPSVIQRCNQDDVEKGSFIMQIIREVSLNPKRCGLFGGVLFGEMKFVLSNFLSNEDLSISYES